MWREMQELAACAEAEALVESYEQEIDACAAARLPGTRFMHLLSRAVIKEGDLLLACELKFNAGAFLATVALVHACRDECVGPPADAATMELDLLRTRARSASILSSRSEQCRLGRTAVALLRRVGRAWGPGTSPMCAGSAHMKRNRLEMEMRDTCAEYEASP